MLHTTRIIFLLVFAKAIIEDPHEQIQLGGTQGLMKSSK